MAKATASEKASAEKVLAREHETYKAHLPRLLHQEGKYVLVHDTEVVGIFDTYSDALSAGYEKFGLKKFLVKRISSVENPVILR